MTRKGDSLRPKDCVLGERAIEAILPRPAMPAHSTMTEYNVSDRNIIDGWRNAGVVTSLADLDLDDIYARLLELPNLQPEVKSARGLYRWLLDISDKAWAHRTAARDRFFKQGYMWGRHGDTLGYFPVSELHHADMEGLPEALLDRLKIVDLPHRVGAEKVQRVFGVQSVDGMAITHRVKNSQLSTDIDPGVSEGQTIYILSPFFADQPDTASKCPEEPTSKSMLRNKHGNVLRR